MKWFVLGFDPEGRIKEIKEREQVKRRWWSNLWDNLYFHLPSPHLSYSCFLWPLSWAVPAGRAVLSYSLNPINCGGVSKGMAADNPGQEHQWGQAWAHLWSGERIHLYHFTSPCVLTFLCSCRSTKGITLKLAGNNHLVPVPRVTDDDLGVLVSVLSEAAFVTGKVFPCVFDIAVIIQENMISLDFSLSSSLFLFVQKSVDMIVQCRYASVTFLILHLFQVWILPIMYWLMLEQRPWQHSSRCQEMFIFQWLVIYFSVVICGVLRTRMSWFGKIPIIFTITSQSILLEHQMVFSVKIFDFW